MIKKKTTLNKVGVEGTHLNIKKYIYEKTYSQHHTQWSKTKGFLVKIRKKIRLSAFPTSINTVLEVIATVMR